jgi:RNase adaptor protein for sRNA GlmZ degradation
MLQSCGKKTARNKFVKGPDAPPNAVKLNCTVLPNPYHHINEYKYKMIDEKAQGDPHRELDVVKFFLREKACDKLDRLVNRGIAAIESGNPVVAQCAYGKHRSRAVLELIGDAFHPSRVYYVHREV